MPAEEADEEIAKQAGQCRRLQNAYNLISCLTAPAAPVVSRGFVEEAFYELRRELQMRKKYYPRLIYFKRITPDVAEAEIAVWKALCEFFSLLVKYFAEKGKEVEP